MGRIYFASNRDVIFESSNQCKNLGTRFNKDGPQFFRVGTAEATSPNGDYLDDTSWSAGDCRLFPENLAPAEGEAEKIGSPRFFDELHTELKDGTSDLVIYIHGYANDFAASVINCACLEDLYRETWRRHATDWGVHTDSVPQLVMFSWPSNGNVFPKYEYFSDAEDAEASGLAMGRALQKFTRYLAELRAADRATIRDYQNRGEVPPDEVLRQCNRRLHLLTHSMGALALQHALVKYAGLIGQRPLPRILDNVFLMAPDVDADALGDPHKLGMLTELANSVHVYHSRGDMALQISEDTKGNPDRLGADGPANLTLLNERIQAVDCRFVDDTGLKHGNHGYYRLRQEVVDDVVMTLANRPADGRKGRQPLMPGRSWALNSAPQ